MMKFSAVLHKTKILFPKCAVFNIFSQSNSWYLNVPSLSQNREPCITYNIYSKSFGTSNRRNCHTMGSPAKSNGRLQEITKDNIESFVSSFDTVLFDCDGVLWIGNEAIKGSPEFIEKLKNMGKKILYVTNNSTKSRAEYVKKCTKLGYPATENEIVGTAYLMAQYVKYTLNYKGKVYLIGNPAIAQEFDKEGIRYIGLGPQDHIDTMDLPTQRQQIDEILDPEVNCVCVGFDPYFSYTKNMIATAYTQREGCHFVATNMDPVGPLGNGKTVPGTGSIIMAVQTAALRKPTVCGKPYPPVGQILHKKYNINPERTLMVGDNLHTDIQLAVNCGFKSLFVETGFSTLEECHTIAADENKDTTNPIPADEHKDTTNPIPADEHKDTTNPIPDENKDTTNPIPDENKDTTNPIPDENKDTTNPIPADEHKDTTNPIPDFYASSLGVISSFINDNPL